MPLRRKNIINKNELANFLVWAKKNSYAAGDKAIKVKLQDGATEIMHVEKNWKYKDRYYGGEPFCGGEVVFYNNEAVWAMNFYGRVAEDRHDQMGPIYKFLQKSLALIDASVPFRGPMKHAEGEFEYHNVYNGNLTQFTGKEIITYRGKEVYCAYYHGGVINIIKE
jgi:hypothetical protein